MDVPDAACCSISVEPQFGQYVLVPPGIFLGLQVYSGRFWGKVWNMDSEMENGKWNMEY